MGAGWACAGMAWLAVKIAMTNEHSFGIRLLRFVIRLAE
jgi:hypothetical protein